MHHFHHLLAARAHLLKSEHPALKCALHTRDGAGQAGALDVGALLGLGARRLVHVFDAAVELRVLSFIMAR